jgi:hypothetical protein
VKIKDARSGTAVELEPVGYQFPDYRPRRGEAYDEWDANWLVIRGRITAPDSSWSFADPCLTRAEADELRGWLSHVADGHVRPAAEVVGGQGNVFFTEPNVSVRLVESAAGLFTVVWYFSQESSPPGAPDEVRFGSGHPVQTVVSASDLMRAVDQWTAELAPFPHRAAT